MRALLLRAFVLFAWSALTAFGWNRFSPWGVPVTRGGAFDLAAARGGWHPISLLEAKELFDGNATVFVDARPRSEYAAGTIQGSFSLPSDDFEAAYPEIEMMVPPVGVDHVIFCSGGTCTDSVFVADQLKERGYERLWVLRDGYDAWARQSYPTEVPL